MKFYKFLITAACIAIAAVCIALIVRVNRAFPNAEEVSYTKDNPADLDGLEITPVNAKVYTLEDYSKISGQYKNVSEEKAKNVRIIVMTVRLRNTTDQVINYVPSFICVVEELNGSNGVQPVSNSMRRITLDPGQTHEVRFQAYMGPNQLNPKKFSKLESSTITLVYSYYPLKKKLVF